MNKLHHTHFLLINLAALNWIMRTWNRLMNMTLKKWIDSWQLGHDFSMRMKKFLQKDCFRKLHFDAKEDVGFLDSGNKDGNRTGQKEDSKALVTIDGEEPSELVSEQFVIESNVESQPKVWSDAPIIEEYESDSEDEYCDFMRRGWARKAELNNVWNNVQRVNKKNQIVPSAVLTRTGIIPVNTARASSTKNFSTTRQSVNRQTVLTNTAMKVNIVNPIVNRVRPANIFHKTPSSSSRPFKKTTVLWKIVGKYIVKDLILAVLILSLAVLVNTGRAAVLVKTCWVKLAHLRLHDFSLHDDEELSLHDDASLDGSVPSTNKGDAPAKPPQIITTNTLSNIKLPVLQKDDYDTWAMEIEHYLEYIDNEVWKVIQNGNSKKRVTKGKDGVYRVLPLTTQEEQFADEKERKARTLLLMVVPKDHLRRFHGMDDAKEIWAAIKTQVWW
ncbi:hypothetical protein Tco_1084446 [Tanacetum coccineum]